MTRIDQASRPASRADISGSMAVMERAFPVEYGEAWTEAQLSGTLCMPGVDLFLARIDNDVGGFALVRRVVDEAELLLIAVDPDHRGKSLGHLLLSTVERELCDLGISHMFLEMRSGNSAERLYRRLGFERIGLRPQYYRGLDGSHYDAVTFGKSLLVGEAPQ